MMKTDETFTFHGVPVYWDEEGPEKDLHEKMSDGSFEKRTLKDLFHAMHHRLDKTFVLMSTEAVARLEKESNAS